MKELVEYIAKALASKPEDVVVVESEEAFLFVYRKQMMTASKNPGQLLLL